MSKTIWYLFHPVPNTNGLNSKIFQNAKTLIDATFVDLTCGNEFDPEVEKQRLADADIIVFQYPIWWSNHPPQLTEFLNKCLEQDFAFGKQFKLKDHQIVTVTTTGASADSYAVVGGTRPHTVNEDKTYWNSIADFIKAKAPQHFNLYSSYNADDRAINKYINKVGEHIRSKEG